jgi:phytol kinase
VTAVLAQLADRPWLAVGVALAAFVALIAALLIYSRAGSPDSESVRKMFHVGSGLLTLAFPFLFVDLWPVLILTGLSATMVAAIQVVPAMRHQLASVLGGERRMTFGEVSFPISVALVFWIARGHTPLLYVIPILVLTLADATGAIVGKRFGRHKFTGASKSLEGSIAFVVVAFFCVAVPLELWGGIGHLRTILIAITLALLVMLLEGSAWQGLDNLFIPIGGCLILRVWLGLGVDGLVARFLVTVVLVAVVLVFRRRTTLEDDSLLAAAFFCYVTWALVGNDWLVAPAIAFIGFAWMSPPTPQNSVRIHDVPAVLSVWLVAIVWVALAHRDGGIALLYPYTIVFAAHLAIFGTSRRAGDYLSRGVAGLAVVAILRSWLMMFAPFVAMEGLTPSVIGAAVAAVAPVTIAVWLFVTIQPGIRDTPITRARWVRQAASAAIGSAIGWGILAVVSRCCAGT